MRGCLLSFFERNPDIRHYLSHGRVPWSRGYKPYRIRSWQRTLGDAKLLSRFREGKTLPAGYGLGLDERIVEYPWILSRVPAEAREILDAGSVFNYPFLLEHPVLAGKQITIMTLVPEPGEKSSRATYVYGDLRKTDFSNASFDGIVCASTLEHIGLDNQKLYRAGERFAEKNVRSYESALREFWRILRPGGFLMVTVPFGRRILSDWYQQFDSEELRNLICTFSPDGAEESSFFRYRSGWNVATEAECGAAEYFDVHETSASAPDGAAAARAVACLFFRKKVL